MHLQHFCCTMDSRQLFFRPSPRPLLKAPLTVRSTGRYTLARQKEEHRSRPFSQLFWVLHGRLEFHRAGHRFHASDGMAFHYAANEPHQIHPHSSGVTYLWLTFDGPLAAQFLDQSGIPPDARYLGPCPQSLFEDLARSVTAPDLPAELHCAELGYRIFLRFTTLSPKDTAKPETADDDPAARMLHRQFHDPNFSIEHLATSLQCHRATLFRHFRQRHRMSPVAYLQRLRTREGLRLLRETNAPVAEIALRCGFRDPAYFARVIRRATGEAPAKVRQQSAPPDPKRVSQAVPP